MSRTKIISMIVAGALALVSIGGAIAYTGVSAQATEATPTLQTTQAAPTTQGAPARGGLKDGAQDTDLAAALGITVEKLQGAYQTANTEALKEAVSKSLLTQAQADQMAANGLSNRPLRGFEISGTSGVDYNALLANALGITTDQLQAARQQVETARLDAAVTSGQLTQAQADEIKARDALSGNAAFQASMKTAFEAAVKQAVTDGVITQAQADLIINNSTGMNFLGGPGGHGGRGGHGGPLGIPDAAPQTPPATSGS